MKPESIFDCCSYFLSEKYWLQVHASILKLKIVVSQSLQKGEECAVLFFLFCKNCILSEHLFGSIYSTKKAPLFKRSRYFFAWSQEASYRVSKQVLDQEEIRFCPKLTNSILSDRTTFWSFFIWVKQIDWKSPQIFFKKCQKYQIIQIFQKTKKMELKLDP